MAAGDAQRVWFRKMVERLRDQWRPDMPFEAMISLRDDLDATLQRIRSEGNIGVIISFAKEFTAIAFKMTDQVDPLHAAGNTNVSRMTVAPSRDCSASARFASKPARRLHSDSRELRREFRLGY
jgi:hypothetical protein